MINLQSMITRAAGLNPAGVATRFMGREHNWSQLENRIARFATALGTLGLKEGDRVAILSLNSDRYYESVFAIPWAGLCMVPLNTRWALAENSYALSDSGTKVLLFDDAFMDQAGKLLFEIDDLSTAIYLGDKECPEWAEPSEALIASNKPATPSSRGGDDMAGIFYTGGTTGFPKGVMQSHRAIWASAIGAIPEFQMTQESRYLHVAPMFHMADFAGSMGATLRAASNIIVAGFDAAQTLETLAVEGVTHTLMVPSMIKMVLNHPDSVTTDCSRLEVVIYGASPMPKTTLQQFMERWPEVGLAQAYGQTELAPIVTMLSVLDHRIGGARLHSAGRPTPVSDVRIVDEEGNLCPTGVCGEVTVRGPHAMIGYWDKPEQTEKTLKDGWIYTGDAGRFDQDGFLYIVDRVKDMVITGGENVFTTEVENAVGSHPAVQDVSVIGIPHEEWGEAVHAIVILVPGQTATEEDIIAHCRELIAGYKLPKSITFRDEPLPLSGAGKVLKTELRKPYWEGLDRQVN